MKNTPHAVFMASSDRAPDLFANLRAIQESQQEVEMAAIRAQKFRALLRFAFTLSVLAGCTLIVFARGESGWLYVPALVLIFVLRRGI